MVKFFDYKFDRHGRITSPGKFEGEMIYLPLYWEVGLDGLADENRFGFQADGSISLDVDDQDIKAIQGQVNFETDQERILGLEAAVKALKGKAKVTFVERGDGFVVEVGKGSTSRLKSFEER